LTLFSPTTIEPGHASPPTVSLHGCLISDIYFMVLFLLEMAAVFCSPPLNLVDFLFKFTQVACLRAKPSLFSCTFQPRMCMTPERGHFHFPWHPRHGWALLVFSVQCPRFQQGFPLIAPPIANGAPVAPMLCLLEYPNQFCRNSTRCFPQRSENMEFHSFPITPILYLAPGVRFLVRRPRGSFVPFLPKLPILVFPFPFGGLTHVFT